MSKTGPRRVLVIDDDVNLAMALQELVGTFGCLARGAYTGGDALKITREWQPDVVLVDLDLPDMDGFAVARLARTLLPNTSQVIACSGYPADTQNDRSLFDAWLMKPVDDVTLWTVLERPGRD